MGKRSDFERSPKDQYYTWSERPYQTIKHFLPYGSTFAEPCCGKMHMVDHLEGMGYRCNWASDIDASHPIPKLDALELTSEHVKDCQYIVTNPPWTRSILHPLIEHFSSLKPTWLLFDMGWVATEQSIPYMRHCKIIVPNPRIKWIKDSKHGSLDDTVWYLFDKSWMAGYTMLYPRQEE
jgi:hypothetical protein